MAALCEMFNYIMFDARPCNRISYGRAGVRLECLHVCVCPVASQLNRAQTEPHARTPTHTRPFKQTIHHYATHHFIIISQPPRHSTIRVNIFQQTHAHAEGERVCEIHGHKTHAMPNTHTRAYDMSGCMGLNVAAFGAKSSSSIPCGQPAVALYILHRITRNRVRRTQFEVIICCVRCRNV